MADTIVSNLPADVIFKFEDYCNGCESKALEIVDTINSDDGLMTTTSTIRCKWRGQCKHLRKQLEKKYEN